MDNTKLCYKIFYKTIKSRKESTDSKKRWIAQCIRENLTDEIEEKVSIT